MRYFRRLPPLLRVASLGLLFPLVFLLLPLNSFFEMMGPSPTASEYADRLLVIGLNLGTVGIACFFVVQSYTECFRQPGAPGPFPLESWQSQVRAFMLAAALPIGALVLAVIISPTSRAFQIVFPVSLLGVFEMAVVSALLMGHVLL
ncbi:MAG: hypothetical protein ACLQUY_05345 [Ktedonobacterales bacterium]